MPSTLFKLTLLIALGFSMAHGAELTVIGKERGFGDTLYQINLFTTSDPPAKIEGERIKGAKTRFTALKLGRYHLVVWGGPGGWAASPAYDVIINIDRDAAIEHQINQSIPERTLELTTDVKLQSFFPMIAAVPCKLQRLQDGKLTPFGYRWRWLKESTPGVFTLSATLEDGTYLVIVPALPYDPQTGEKVPPANILTFPILFDAGQTTCKATVLTHTTHKAQPEKK